MEAALRRDDPAFTARLSGEGPHFAIVSALCIGLYLLIPLVSLVSGMLAVHLTLNVAAIVIATVVIRRPILDRPRTGRPPTAVTCVMHRRLIMLRADILK